MDICIHRCIYIYIYLSLSLCIYIYIYTYISYEGPQGRLVLRGARPVLNPRNSVFANIIIMLTVNIMASKHNSVNLTFF